MKLHELGWRSVYIPTVLAVGDTPENIEAYTKQQTRWATARSRSSSGRTR
ncbi:hypothetical protein [Georgenia sp. SUBG003]